jgi:formiminotetrahydrofolate cyclodeaminase
MRLVDQTLESFSGALASASPTPGGGTCSALNALVGASFIAMVAGITVEKPDFTDAKPELRRIMDEAEKLRRLFLRLIDEDSAAYERFASAKSGEEAAAALRACVRPPFELLEGAAAALRLAGRLSVRYYPPTASDVGIAALNLETACRGAYLTVSINLKGTGADGEEEAEYRKRSRALLAEAEALSKEIYGAVRRHVED